MKSNQPARAARVPGPALRPDESPTRDRSESTAAADRPPDALEGNASARHPETHVQEPVCGDARAVAHLLGISPRHVRAMHSRAALPAPLAIGRRRVWRLDEIRAWVDAGMPPRDRWQWAGGRSK